MQQQSRPEQAVELELLIVEVGGLFCPGDPERVAQTCRVRRLGDPTLGGEMDEAMLFDLVARAGEKTRCAFRQAIQQDHQHVVDASRHLRTGKVRLSARQPVLRLGSEEMADNDLEQPFGFFGSSQVFRSRQRIRDTPHAAVGYEGLAVGRPPDICIKDVLDKHISHACRRARQFSPLQTHCKKEALPVAE